MLGKKCALLKYSKKMWCPMTWTKTLVLHCLNGLHRFHCLGNWDMALSKIWCLCAGFAL
jgi:hypothetical protein